MLCSESAVLKTPFSPYRNSLFPVIIIAIILLLFVTFSASNHHLPLIQGCDASILLDSDGNQNINTEMESGRNFGIRKRSSIQLIKEVVESECPGKVSCADLIIMAASNAVAVSGGPVIRIPLGRKDSTTANNLLADHFLPRGSISIEELIDIFSPMGMTLEESIAILGLPLTTANTDNSRYLSIHSRFKSEREVKKIEGVVWGSVQSWAVRIQ